MMNLHFNWYGCFFQCHSLGSLAVGFVWLCSWKTQPGPIYTDLSEERRLLPNIWQYVTSSILSTTRCSGLVLDCRKAPLNLQATHLGWCSENCTHPSSSSKYGKWNLYQKVLFWSHLTTGPSPMPPLVHPDGPWQASYGSGHVLVW